MKQRETIFKEKVLTRLKLIPNSWWTKIQQTGIHGTPDIIGCVAAFFVAIELKRDDKEKAGDLQAYVIAKIKGANGFACVATPGNFDKVVEQLIWLATFDFAGKTTKTALHNFEKGQ